MVHHWAQTGEIRGPSTRTENAFAKALELAGMAGRRLEYWPAGGNHEGALSAAVDGSRKTSRDDAERDGWVTGHYDYQWWMLDGELWVDDLKTGKYYPNPPWGYQGHVAEIEVGANRFPQDVDSPQLKTYALALSELLEYAGYVTVTLTHWPRLPVARRHAPPERFWTRYSHGDLMQHWARLETMYEQAQHNKRTLIGKEDSLILNPGDHCRFCPVRDCMVKEDLC